MTTARAGIRVTEEATRGRLVTGPHVERFWSKVERSGPGECWVWTASVHAKRGGYGQFRLRPYILRAHIVAYTLIVGAIPKGHVLDHLCRNPRCVNPAHLEPVTNAENVRRGMAPSAIAVRLNRCSRGHRFTPENTIAKSDGRRECRTCAAASQRRNRAKRRAS